MGSIDSNNDQLRDVLSKYAQERDKRLRSDGLDQYADVRTFQSYKHLADDPWAAEAGARQWQIPTGARESRSKVIIVGTGFGGLTYAARLLLNTNIRPEDVVMVDNAAGFGGAWYWNRYPGLMCDVESSLYMPLLEETGYTPKNRYSYGAELREHAENIATLLQLQDRALWKATVKGAKWDEQTSEWTLSVHKKCADGSVAALDLRTEFVVLTAGLLHNPKLPKLPGIEDFAGHAFHTARWDYNCTGGSPNDTALTGLKDKKVIFVGTGATAVQAVPHLAEWAQELFVVQRTPASVDTRGQHAIDPRRFEAEVSKGNTKGWQKARRENFAAWVSNTDCDVDMVQDSWTTFPSYSALVGSPSARGLTAAKAEEYARFLQNLDLPRQERIRARVDEIVKDRKTAESLKAWYSGWCKRPCFHDDYLPAFNRPNVHLVDTAGRGIDAFTKTGIVCGTTHYDADVVIFGTGFEPWSRGSPSERAGFKIIGRQGMDMDTKWATGVETLHGCLVREFPNLIISGVNQTGTSVNYNHMADIMATHAAYIIAAAEARAGAAIDGRRRTVIEPSAAAVAVWGDRIVERAHAYVGFAGCTPSYTTAEGKAGNSDSPEAAREARGLNWGTGILDFIKVLDDWQSNGQLEGINVRFVEAK